MFVKLWHQPHAIFPHDPGRFITVFVIFESVIDWNSCHPDVNAWLQRVAFGIQPQNGRMLCDSIAQQNHVNVMVKPFVSSEAVVSWFSSCREINNTSRFSAAPRLLKNRMIAKKRSVPIETRNILGMHRFYNLGMAIRLRLEPARNSRQWRSAISPYWVR